MHAITTTQFVILGASRSGEPGDPCLSAGKKGLI
jgi:hypothetical protein